MNDLEEDVIEPILTLEEQFANMRKRHSEFRINHEYYIDTSGRIIKYKGDLELLYESCSTHNLIAEILYNCTPDDLYNRGFILIGTTGGLRMKSRPTQSQIDTLFDLEIRYVYDQYNNEIKIW